MRLCALSLMVSLVSILPEANIARAEQPVTSLITFPATLEFHGARDGRRVLVFGKSDGGETIDLTAAAVVEPAAPLLTRNADGDFVPKAVGTTLLKVMAAGLTVDVPVTVKSIDAPPISFVRDVMPILSKAGCNAGTCHGAQDGKNGFKLSLRGYDPRYDYDALVDELSGRRFDRSSPEQSLMLLKPTQGVPHVGGFLFDEQSRHYAILKQWITEGAAFDNVTRVQRLEVAPLNPVLQREGKRIRKP